MTVEAPQKKKDRVNEMPMDRVPPSATPAPEKPAETKAQRFKRLGERRVPKALKALQHIENLTVRGQYEWTPAQQESIMSALTRAVQRIADGFAGKELPTTTFSL